MHTDENQDIGVSAFRRLAEPRMDTDEILHIDVIAVRRLF